MKVTATPAAMTGANDENVGRLANENDRMASTTVMPLAAIASQVPIRPRASALRGSASLCRYSR